MNFGIKVRKINCTIRFVIAFAISIALSYATVNIPEEISQIYASSWTEYTEQQLRRDHPFHTEKNVLDVVNAHMSCEKPMTNTAVFGVTIYTDKEVIPLKYGGIVSSGKLKTIGVKQSKEIISAIPGGYISFFNNIFELSPFLKKTYASTTATNLISFLERCITAPIDGLINDRTYGSDINSFLHCEQAFVNKLLLDDSDDFIAQLAKTPIEENVNSITFDIITYNDMCPKCFSTCFKAFNQLKKKICESLKAGGEFTFKIIVSSFRPYKIDSELTESLLHRKHSRGINSSIMDDSFFTQYTRNKTIGTMQISDIQMTSFGIEQFVNPFFAKVEGNLNLQKKVSNLETIKDTVKLPISICEMHIRELSMLLQYFAENNVQVNEETMTKIDTFFKLISPDIESISGMFYSAKKYMLVLPK